MTEKLCPGCPGDPNETCCKPELRVQVWQQQAGQQPAAEATPEPVRIGALMALTAERDKLNTALQIACSHLTDEQAAQVAAAMPDPTATPEPVGEHVAVIDSGCLMFVCDAPLPDGTKRYTHAAQTDAVCNNGDCSWGGPLSECCMLGAIGPLCPVCRETVQLCGAAQPAQPARVPEIDYQALIQAAWGAHKYAQGTRGCIAFKHGAEWFRGLLTSTPAKGATHG